MDFLLVCKVECDKIASEHYIEMEKENTLLFQGSPFSSNYLLNSAEVNSKFQDFFPGEGGGGERRGGKYLF